VSTNKERVKLLVDALNSDEFKQGQNRLEVVLNDGEVRNCCLGIACRVAMQNGLELATETLESVHGSGFGVTSVTSFEGEINSLPKKVVNWYGFATGDPELRTKRGSGIESAIILNDILGAGFTEIGAAFAETFLKEVSND